LFTSTFQCSARGYVSGIFFAGSALAERRERALSEKHFEVIHFRKRQLASGALETVLSALWTTGALIVFSSERLSTEDKDDL
jgi:hypothetical protein